MKIKKYLKEGKRVLFVGLPCQVAAVKSYIGTVYDNNLYTVDLICHGTPSPKILEVFLAQYNITIENLSDIQFRNNNKFAISENMKYIVPYGILDAYSMAFLNSACYTENCYYCHYANLERVSDITLGDSWGSQLDEKERARGISLILCQSIKGQKMLEQTELKLIDVDLDQAIEHNHQLKQPSTKPNIRENFFQELKKGKKFNSVVRRNYPRQSLKQLVKLILIKTKVIRGGAVADYGISYIKKNVK